MHSTCPSCTGPGWHEDHDLRATTCETCEGSGRVDLGAIVPDGTALAWASRYVAEHGGSADYTDVAPLVRRLGRGPAAWAVALHALGMLVADEMAVAA